MKDIIETKPKGHLFVGFYDKESGDIVDKIDEKNLVVDYAKVSIIQCIAGGDQSLYAIRNIALGDDIGSGTPFEPEPPQAGYTGNEMNTIYQSNGVEIFYPNDVSVVFSLNLDGNAIVDASNALYGNTGDTADINSSALLLGNGRAFSYKRFKVKVVTRFIDVAVRWTIEF